MDPGWLSNAYLVADRVGGTAVFVGSGAHSSRSWPPSSGSRIIPLLLTTHAHEDHVVATASWRSDSGCVLASTEEEVDGAEPLATARSSSGELHIELRTPGHTRGMLSFVVDRQAVFTGDTLFTGSVGGTQEGFEDARRSVMDVLMGLPHELVVYPGHSEETTIGRSGMKPVRPRLAWGRARGHRACCHVGGAAATLVVWSNDYDGGGETLQLRFGDDRGRDRRRLRVAR